MRMILSLILICLLFCTACSMQGDAQKKKVAILMPVSHPSMEKIRDGIVQTMDKAHPDEYRFDIYNAQGNKSLMRSEIEEISRQDYVLVYTVGTGASQMAIEVLGKKNVDVPVVFTAVNDPDVFVKNSSKRRFTGVQELLNFDEELGHLLKYRPELKNLMLVYNPAEPGLQKDRRQIEKILEERNLTLITVEVFQTNELLAKVTPFMQKVDAMILLKDNTAVLGVDVLIKLCDRHHIPLMASDLDSPDKGAAFGYGVYEIDFGIEAAKKGLRIIDEGVHPELIPITPVPDFTLVVNREAAIKQGISPSLLEKEVSRP